MRFKRVVPFQGTDVGVGAEAPGLHPGLTSWPPLAAERRRHRRDAHFGMTMPLAPSVRLHRARVRNPLPVGFPSTYNSPLVSKTSYHDM